jgi:DNA polymerase I-like protein with 3'-5' exonuclease and polymerase domains
VAFHCLLWIFIQLTNEFKKRKLKSKLVGQIHDSILIDIYPPELYEVYILSKYYSEVALRKQFEWIIVPIEIEVELTEIDKSWADKKEWKPEIKLDYTAYMEKE